MIYVRKYSQQMNWSKFKMARSLNKSVVMKNSNVSLSILCCRTGVVAFKIELLRTKFATRVTVLFIYTNGTFTNPFPFHTYFPSELHIPHTMLIDKYHAPKTTSARMLVPNLIIYAVALVGALRGNR